MRGKYTYNMAKLMGGGMSTQSVAALVLSHIERKWRSKEHDFVAVLDGSRHLSKDTLKMGVRYNRGAK